MSQLRKPALTVLLLICLFLMSAAVSFALSVPTATDAGYEAYDIWFNKVVKGPWGFVIGGLGMAGAGGLMYKSQYLAAGGAALGTLLGLTGDKIVPVFGAMIG